MTASDDQLARAYDLPRFPLLVGISLLEVSEKQIVGTLLVTEELANRNGVLHGGALMAFGDTLAGTGATLNLPGGKSTTTVESKTNFLRGVKLGETLTGTAICLHPGRKTSLWQTTIIREDGKLAAIVSQTQMTIDWNPS